jgi:hypothetical protein
MSRLETAGTKYKRTEESEVCPVCGAAMMQTDKLEVGEYIFVWFECSREDCDGQWSGYERKLHSAEKEC